MPRHVSCIIYLWQALLTYGTPFPPLVALASSLCAVLSALRDRDVVSKAQGEDKKATDYRL